MTLEEMQAAFKALGEPAFRAKQVFVWLHRGAVSFDEMTNLSKPLRQKLDELYDITAPQIVISTICSAPPLAPVKHQTVPQQSP